MLSVRHLFFGALLLSYAGVAFAHQPKVVFPQEAPILIQHPEVSQAFYAELSGVPQEFRIVAPEPFWLFAQILVPEGATTGNDYSATVELINGNDTLPFATLSGTSSTWEPFHDSFAGDDYLAGPDYEGQAPAGEYRLVVSSPDNLGKFVLSVGTEEKFGPRELLNTAKELPIMKAYLGVSPLYAYNNRIGAILAGVLAAFGFLVWLILKLIKRRQVKKLPRLKV